jgi:hypothetical protein
MRKFLPLAVAILLIAMSTFAVADARLGKIRVALPHAKGEVTVMLSGDRTSVMKETHGGAAEFDGVQPGKYIVSSFGGALVADARVPKSVDVGAGQTIDVSLEPGTCTIKGIVRSGGKPVAGGDTIFDGYISWFPATKPRGAVFQGGVQVKADGSFQIDGLVRDRYQLIYETRNAMLQSYFVTINGEMTSFDIDLPTARIEGTLVGRAPKVIGPANPVGSIQVFPIGHDLPPHSGCLVEADPSGRFSVEHLSPGRYSIVGYGLATTVKVDGEGSVVKAVLQAPEKTGEIAGLITSGQLPIRLSDFQHIYVTAFPKDDGEYNFHIWNSQAQLDPQSHRYQIKNVPVGTYGVLVSSFGVSPPPTLTWIPDIDVQQGVTRQLAIEIPKGRVVRLMYHDEFTGDRALAQWDSARLRLPNGESWDKSMLDQVPELALPLGDYTIEAECGGSGVVSQKFTVSEGAGTQQIVIDGGATN